ncbi:hypothetical protein ONZ45_g12414 [Pleurotus djamor]|nr:hypothetical protein ONZ45_g12414 [Pleurotus djamor]
MSFADSSSNIRLGDHTLYASVQNGDGDWGDCELNLNTILGNHDGEFAPGGENFFDSGQGIWLWLDGTTLRGQLMNVEGEWKDAEIDLNRFIGNDNGSLLE